MSAFIPSEPTARATRRLCDADAGRVWSVAVRGFSGEWNLMSDRYATRAKAERLVIAISPDFRLHPDFSVVRIDQ